MLAVLEERGNNQIHSVSVTTGDAVGVPETDMEEKVISKKWFVGVTNANKEKKCKEALLRLGLETYLPIQQEEHEWSRGRIRKIDRRVIPGYIFIHCTEEERKLIFSDAIQRGRVQPFLSRFFVNPANKKDSNERSPIAIVPDEQMKQLMFMVEKASSPVYPCATPLHVGDKVRVIKGSMKGFEGELEILPDKTSSLVVRIKELGAAKMSIDTSMIEIVKDKE